MCDFVTYSNLRDKVWSNISFSVDCRFLFPADGSDELHLIKLELRNYTVIFNVYEPSLVCEAISEVSVCEVIC